MRRPDGTTFVADVTSSIFTDDQGSLRSCVVFRDVSEQVSLRDEMERQRQRLEQLVVEDPLSRLLNRRGFMAAAQHAISFADREAVPMQLAFCDIDDFKGINDRFGHRVGDETIRRIGRAIAGATRQVDVAGRIAGDEFVILLFDATGDDAELVLGRIAQHLDSESETKSERGSPPPVTFSAGIVERRPESDLSLEALLEAADKRMYAQKTLRRVLPRGRDPRG